MAELVTSVASKLIEVLCHEAISRVCEMWGYKTQLAELKETVSQVKAVFLDANVKWDHLSHGDKEFIRKLRDVVYDADDVFDELLTLAQQEKLDGKLKKHYGKIFQKVRRFFSSKNQVNEAYRMSRQVKDIKKRLDAIANDRAKFNLGVDLRPICRRPKETCSYVEVNDIIGRDDDKEKIVKMLLAPNASEYDPDIVAIVGVGGLGKTALAQLVFGDERIKQEFPDETFRLWVCVSDHDVEQFDDTLILCKILELVTKKKPDYTSKEFLVKTFQENIRGKKFLLVLDDVWNEKHDKWLGLKTFLRMGHGGSKIIVTTRSHITATIIESEHVYELDGLSSEYSQRLFEMSAFGGQKLENHKELVEIGMNIVDKCCRIPLALKVVGSLLYGHDINKWQSIQDSELAKIGDCDNGIIFVLKLSYDNLEPSLKSCFSYCAVFPKDFILEKEEIIGLWLAQGYIVSLDGHQNQEDAAEEHFKILLRRCFFQVDVINDYGDVESVKMHDLMHDVAQKVGEEELCIVTSKTYNMEDRFRHVYVGDESLKHFMGNQKIRSYIDYFGHYVDAQINNCIHLRVLVLSSCNFKSLPDSIGELLHLRYLDLSENVSLEVLCESITKLYNLQTLNLSWCKELIELPVGTNKFVNLRYLNLKYCNKLRELPKGTSKLVNLRHLNNEQCYGLNSMPSGIDKLKNLKVLPRFVVGYKSLTNEEQSGDIGMLKDLKELNKIQGKMRVKIGKHYRHVEDINNDTGNYLKSMEYLRELVIDFELGYGDADSEGILEKLEPPPNLQELFLVRYEGKRIRWWERAGDNRAISLSLLVHIDILGCRKLEQLPVLSKLPRLKSLQLEELNSMEYMENGMSNDTEASTTQFFPSLESLDIIRLPKLKGWWKVEGFNLYFPRLLRLRIMSCPNLASNIICPTLKKLIWRNNSERLQITYGTLQGDVIELRTLAVSQVGHVKSIPRNCEDKEIENKGESLIEEIEKQSKCSSSFLQELTICGRDLEESAFCEDEEDDEDEDNDDYDDDDDDEDDEFDDEDEYEHEDEDGDNDKDEYESEDEDDEAEEPWKSFHHSLRKLSINGLRRMKRLPKGMHYLTSLKSLQLRKCENMNEVPEWISCLSSLQSLHIWNCPNIKTFPESFKHLTSLKSLKIDGCPDLIERLIKLNEDFSKIHTSLMSTILYQQQKEN